MRLSIERRSGTPRRGAGIQPGPAGRLTPLLGGSPCPLSYDHSAGDASPRNVMGMGDPRGVGEAFPEERGRGDENLKTLSVVVSGSFL